MCKIALGMIAVLAASPAVAQWKPDKPVEIVVPTTPGGAIDTISRLIQKIGQDSKLVETPLVVVNKPGGGQSVAMSHLDQKPGDAHYILVSTMSLMTTHMQGRTRVNYTDYTPLANLFGEPMTMVVRPESPLRSGRDIQEKLKADPQSLSIGVGIAVGGTNHLAAALVLRAMGVDPRKAKTVVFQANAEAMTAIMGGHVDLAPMSAATAINAARQGRLRILGVSSARRGDGPLADIPTWKEQGYDVVFTNVRFVLGPRGLSPAQIAYWDGFFEKMVRTDEWKGQVAKNLWEMDFAGHKGTVQRLGTLYTQLRGAMVDSGLIKE